MNIAIITTWFPAGAGYVSKAYEKVLEKNHKVFIYARGGQTMRNDKFWDKENVTWGQKHSRGMDTKHFLRWLKKNSIEIAFFNEQRFWQPVIEAKKNGICIGAYIDYYTQETVKAFEIYDFLICNTKRHYSVFSWHKNAYYVPWGTDISKFKPENSGIVRQPTFIISAGWQPMKKLDRRGSLLALEAFQKVSGSCKLIVYSQVEQSKFADSWTKLLNDSRIEVKVGTFDPFPFNEGDIYLYPSRLDGIGLTLPEALSSGLSAITTNNAPMNEFVIDNYNGFLVDVEKYLGRHDGYYWAESICNVNSLAEKMQKYIDDNSLVQIHKQNAREHACKHLDWNKNAIQLSNIFVDSYKSRDQKYNKELLQILERLDLKLNLSISSLIKFFFRKN